MPHGNSYFTRKLLSMVISEDKLRDEGDSKNANIIIKNMFNMRKLLKESCLIFNILDFRDKMRWNFTFVRHLNSSICKQLEEICRLCEKLNEN